MFRVNNHSCRNLFSVFKRTRISVSLSPTQTTDTLIIPNNEKSLKGIDKNQKSFILGSKINQLVYSSKTPTRKLVTTSEPLKDIQSFRKLVHSSIQFLRNHKITSASISLNDFSIEGVKKTEQINHLARVAHLSAYTYSKYRKPKV